MKWFFRNKYTFAAFSILTSVAFSAFLALFFSIAGGRYWDLVIIMFFWFGAPLSVAGLLVLLINLDESLSFGYGCALYYGSVFLAGLLQKWFHIAHHVGLIIAFVIVALSCYVFWLKHHKKKEEKD